MYDESMLRAGMVEHTIEWSVGMLPVAILLGVAVLLGYVEVYNEPP